MTPPDWYVYMLECADGSLYTGIARDIDARLNKHNNGKASRYTRSRLPVKLVYCEAATDRSNASQREAEIKRLTRSAKLSLLSPAPD